ncbi:hypothetical protein J2T57_001591 [Natronocella acetinitrilica]|uniref:Uncharacterized protein n=1 Tax=Natronocella acetinitrilica TaxID=414046 RepID=A0AAE3G3P0_9GAMM|nr:hypothetical protein [Natronocella acetinitrilica]MCP1674489.1 hypothetical protein [Natronocella acetinitrilica]
MDVVREHLIRHRTEHGMARRLAEARPLPAFPEVDGHFLARAAERAPWLCEGLAIVLALDSAIVLPQACHKGYIHQLLRNARDQRQCLYVPGYRGAGAPMILVQNGPVLKTLYPAATCVWLQEYLHFNAARTLPRRLAYGGAADLAHVVRHEHIQSDPLAYLSGELRPGDSGPVDEAAISAPAGRQQAASQALGR